MKILYYKSLICPRCIWTNRLMSQLRRAHPEIEIEEVELLTNLSRARADGVQTLPTLIIGTQRFTYAPPMHVVEAALATASGIMSQETPAQPMGVPAE